MSDKKLTITVVLPIINAYVAKKGNGVGGNLYIVLSNKNILDEHIEFCLNQAEEKNDADGVNLARVLLKLSKTQRLKLCHQWSTKQPDYNQNQIH